MSVFILARLTVLEALRRQFYLLTIFLAFLLFLLPVLANVFGLGASERVVKDVALTLIGLYGLVLAVFLGSVAVPGDIERRTAFPLLARPLHRRAYLWGKWLGLTTFIAASLLVLTACVMGSSMIFLGHVEPRMAVGVAGYLLEDGVILAMCLLFSTFCSPPLAAVLGLFGCIMGGLSDTFVTAFLQGSAQGVLARVLKACLPNFQLFHVKDAIVHGDPFPASFAWAVALYGIAWIVLLQLIAEASFRRRDL